jgi:hypothetical protein
VHEAQSGRPAFGFRTRSNLSGHKTSAGASRDAIGPNDLPIAAHALESGLILVTDNMDEFVRARRAATGESAEQPSVRGAMIRTNGICPLPSRRSALTLPEDCTVADPPSGSTILVRLEASLKPLICHEQTLLRLPPGTRPEAAAVPSLSSGRSTRLAVARECLRHRSIHAGSSVSRVAEVGDGSAPLAVTGSWRSEGKDLPVPGTRPPYSSDRFARVTGHW